LSVVKIHNGTCMQIEAEEILKLPIYDDDHKTSYENKSLLIVSLRGETGKLKDLLKAFSVFLFVVKLFVYLSISNFFHLADP
jgi:hypothetical protein